MQCSGHFSRLRATPDPPKGAKPCQRQSMILPTLCNVSVWISDGTFLGLSYASIQMIQAAISGADMLVCNAVSIFLAINIPQSYQKQQIVIG